MSEMDRLKRFINRILDEAIKEIKSLRQSLMNAVQNAECREEELGKEIEQLKKEKEWLINKIVQPQYLTGLEERKERLIQKMQQALKEEWDG